MRISEANIGMLDRIIVSLTEWGRKRGSKDISTKWKNGVKSMDILLLVFQWHVNA